MRKFAVWLALLAGGVTAAQAACTVQYVADQKVLEAIAKSGGWRMSMQNCEFLRRKNLYLQVTAEEAVLDNVALGWASVRLYSEGDVASNATFSSTNVDRNNASTPRARELMLTSIERAIAGFDFEVAAEQIARKLQKAK